MPNNRKFEITDARSGAAITVRVVTQAEKTEFVGIQEEGDHKIVKIRLTAEAAGSDEANEEVLEALAFRLEISVNRLEVVAGANGRDKLVTIMGLSTGQVEELLSN
ncbi:MAG: DUF167 domain-containing protein [Anaerolineae bacterium]|jgi:uncharacterized protein YggU (UPF0235/DUF167 family)|nr:DUF167 domain-containing protein [Anaerolineae bacterium]